MFQIITELTEAQAIQVVQLAKKFNEESDYADLGFDEEKVWEFVWMMLHPETPYHSLFAIDQDDNVIGFICCHITDMLWTDYKVLEASMLYVSKDKRGGFIGMRLIKEMLQWADQQLEIAYVLFSLSAGIENDLVAKLAERAGFEPTGQILSMRLNHGNFRRRRVRTSAENV